MIQKRPTLLYFIYFLACFNLVSSVQTIYFTHEGISFFHIGFLMSIFQVTKLVSELPTGYVADKFGKKRSVIVSVLLEIVGMVLALCFPNMLGFTLAMIVGGIAYTLSSGALDALLIEEMLATKTRTLEQINSVTRVLFYVGMGLSSLLAGIVASSDFYWIYIVSIVVQILLVYLLVRRLKAISEQAEANKIIKISYIFEYLNQHKIVTYILGVDFTYAIAFLPIGVFYINYLSSQSIPISTIGVLTTLQLIGSAILGIWAYKLLKKFPVRYILLGGPLIALGVLFLFAISKDVKLGIVCYIMTSVIFCSYAPIFSKIFHEHLENHIRATVMSIRSLLFALVGLTMNPLFGYLIEKVGFQTTFMIAIFLSISLTCINGLIFKKVLATY